MDNRNKDLNVSIDDSEIIDDPIVEEEHEELIGEESDEPIEKEPVEKEPIEEVIKDEEEEGFEENEEEPTPIEKKLTDVSREATTLHFKNKKLTETIEEAKYLPEPTIDELKNYAKAQGADYDELDEFSRNILKKTYINEKRFEKIQSVTDEAKRIDEWAKKVDDFIEESVDSGKYPSLSTLGKHFKRFAMKETHRGIDLNLLVASFLYTADKVVPKNKRSLLLSGGKGSAVPRKPEGLSVEQIATIRERDPREYKRLIKAGKINLEI